MNKNKGFIGLGLIIAIILGIVVIGGGAYYLGNSNSKQEVKVEENNLSNNSETNQNQNQNLPADNNQQVNTTTSTTPSITVLSPNGGEVWKTGESHNITWKSSGVDKVTIWLTKEGASDVAEIITGSSVVSASSGKYMWTIPLDNNDINFGGNFRIHVSADKSNLSDLSDNTFTINSGTNNVLKESGDDINGKHIGFIKSIDSKNNLSIDYVQWVSPCVAKASTGYCMNGFDVINDNMKLRSFPILDTAQIKLQTYSQNSSGGFNWNQVVSLPVFKNALNPSLLYWVTLKDGKVIEITEQYRP